MLPLRSILAGGLLLAASHADAQTGPAAEATPPTAPEPALGDPLPDRPVSFPGGVLALADVTYSTIEGYRPMVLDIYLPPDRSGPKPLIVYVHGGGWRNGHTRQSGAFTDFPALLAELASRGYVVASVEYRLSAEARFPAALEDVRTAVRFLKDNASRYGIDSARTGIFGGSAGGQLAILHAVTCGREITGGDRSRADVGDCVNAAVGWYGVYEFPAMPSAGPARAEDDYLGCSRDSCTPAQLAAASAVRQVDAGDPPILLLHGTDDRVVPYQQTERMVAALQEAGIPVESELFPGIGHSWIGRTEEETRTASLRALNLTYTFFDKHLQPGR